MVGLKKKQEEIQQPGSPQKKNSQQGQPRQLYHGKVRLHEQFMPRNEKQKLQKSYQIPTLE